MSEINKQPSQEEIDVVILRLEVASSELHFSSGDDSQSFSRDDMIKQIKDGTDVGREFVETEFAFLRAIKSIKLSMDTVQKVGGMVVLPLKEYEKLCKRALSTYKLKGKKAEELDVLVRGGMREYKAGKCKTIKSLSDLD